MSDSRYPHLVPVEETGTGLSLDALRRAQSIARVVKSRTECGTCLNKETGELYFHLGEIWRGVTSIPFLGTGGVVSEVDVDRACRFIMLGRVAPDVKDHWAREQKRLDEYEKEQRTLNRLADMRKDGEKGVERIEELRGMGKHFKRSQLVNGFAKQGA